MSYPAWPNWLEPDWAAQPLGRGGRPEGARDRFPEDYSWLARWTMYAELMTRARYQGVQGQRTAAEDRTLAWLGDPARFIHAELHPRHLDISRRDLGRKLLDELILPAVAEANEQGIPTTRGVTPGPDQIRGEQKTLLGWYHSLHERSEENASTAVNRRIDATYKDINATLRDARWEKGMHDPEGFPVRSQRALRYLTTLLDQRFEAFRRDDSDRRFGPDDLDVLLPAALAEKARNGEQRMLGFRLEYPHEPDVQQGISASGRLQILEGLLPQLARRMLARQSMLVLGPTSSGKSHAGRIIASHIANRGMKAIILLPIKALVTQAVQEWAEWLDKTDLKKQWSVVPGSRDYPQHDETLVRGDFRVAVMIPEKLSALLGRGMRLDGVGAIIVDELQMLSTDSRGTNLEMLITRLRSEHPLIPLVGLAAPLDKSSTNRIRNWLGIEEKAVIQTGIRPVPLEKIVRGIDAQEMVLRSDGETAVAREIPDSASKTGRPPTGLRLNGDQTRVLTLCLDLLAERSMVSGSEEFSIRGVLCFVQNRDLAQRFATAAQTALNSWDLGPEARPAGLDKNPFLGRFSTLDEDIAQQRWGGLRRIPESRERNGVIDALRSGVGFHTARLDPFLREEVEWAFREGNIRLLFATDTLKLGINLPAEAVVVASVTTPNNMLTSSVIDRDTVGQRLGRAGRLGISSSGRGYLVIPAEPLPDRDLEFAPDDEEELAKYVPPRPGLTTIRKRALAALADRDAVFNHYIKYRQRGGNVQSRLDQNTLAYLLLEHSRRIFDERDRESLEHEVNRMFELSLKAQQPGARDDISAAAVVNMLIRSKLLKETRPDFLRITALGRAIGHSGIPLDDAAAVEDIADALAAGAGQLTLLYAAVRTRQVVDSTNWVALRNNLPLESESEQIRGVLQLATVLISGAPDASDVRLPATTLAALRRFVPEAGDLLGQGAAADRMRDLIDVHTVDVHTIEPRREDASALLRACVLLLWMRGCPFPIINECVEVLVRHRPDRAKPKGETSPPIHPVDVRNLGENTSYIFDTVSDYVGVVPENNNFRRFERMSDAVAYGLPIELAALSRLNLRATHRDRLVHMVPAIDEGAYDDIPDLLRRNTRRPNVRAMTQRQDNELRNTKFEIAEYKKILHEIHQQEARNKEYADTLSQGIGKKVLQGPGYTAETVVRLLGDTEPASAAAQLAVLFRDLGLQVTDGRNGTLRVRGTGDSDRELTVEAITEEITLRDARARADEGIIIVACGGVALDVLTAPLVDSEQQTVIVEPSVLVEAAFKLAELESPPASSEFGEQDLDDFTGITDEDLALFDNDEHHAEPDEFELDAVRRETGERMLRILRSAPPVMSRNDAQRLFDGVRLTINDPSNSGGGSKEDAR
ncbi:DEAD/DEAH box helicase [Nocardia sp. CA-136227]|uniref:DEAD/DEAH box helicase n=1 Tax=Nocardia sp. CA-136227 TaxID=3239979 RepID=UPI003D972B04